MEEQNTTQETVFKTPPTGHGTNRNIALCILLCIVTCGIYFYYWLYKLDEELSSLSGEKQSVSGVVLIILSIVTANIYLWYWLYKAGEQTDLLKQRQGKAASSSPILFLVMGILEFAIIPLALIQDTINGICQ